jgi:hypothetical protein
VPAIDAGSRVVGSRLDRHLSVLSGPAVPLSETEEATSLMRELTARDESSTRTSRGASVLLLAPLRRLRRSLFGGPA